MCVCTEHCFHFAPIRSKTINDNVENNNIRYYHSIAKINNNKITRLLGGLVLFFCAFCGDILAFGLLCEQHQPKYSLLKRCRCVTTKFTAGLAVVIFLLQVQVWYKRARRVSSTKPAMITPLLQRTMSYVCVSHKCDAVCGVHDNVL